MANDVKALIAEEKQKAQAQALQVSVDLDAFTAGNVNEFLAANRANDMNKITDAIIPFILTIPKEWGDSKARETYLKIPFLVWKQIVQHIADIINAMSSKN
jgi:hypothetical protein